MQCVFKLRAFRRSRVKQLAGFQYILRENWFQLEALLVKPWTQGPLTVNPKLFYTRLDDMELPPNDPVQNRPFFCTWEKAPQDFVNAPQCVVGTQASGTTARTESGASCSAAKG